MVKKGAIAAVLLCACLCLGLVPARSEEPADAFWKFYQQHPQLQDFYPFGLYGGAGCSAPFALSQENYNKLILDLMAENSINVIWSTSTDQQVNEGRGSWDDENFQKRPKLNAFGQWYFGEELPAHNIKALTSLEPWMRYNRPVFSKYQRATPLLNEQEMAEVEKELQGSLTFAKDLAGRFPETVIGFISDDEPEQLAPGIAALRIIEKNTGLPATTVLPSWGQFMTFAPQMQLITGDWYVTSRVQRDNWSIAPRLRWLQQNYPDRIFWFMPLASSWERNQIKPGLRDARPTREELRMQCWQAVAWGCKGVFFYGMWNAIDWAGGQDSILNTVLQPNTHNLWAEIRELGTVLNSVGPLLISCRPEVGFPLKVKAGTVRFPEFKGPSLDYGLLKDVRHDRYFLIPWNNDIYQEQSGTIVLPNKLLAGRKVYDLMNLKEVTPDDRKTLPVRLPAGGGAVFLLGSPQEYAACVETMLRHEVQSERVKAWMRIRIANAQSQKVDTKEAGELIQRARTAEENKDWTQAQTFYRDAVAAVDKAETKIADIGPTRQALARVATVLSDTDDLIRTYALMLELPVTNGSIRWSHYQNKYVGKEIREWVSMVQAYYDAQFRYRSGQLADFSLYDCLLTLEERAQKNQAAIQAAIERCLVEKRRPVKVALITPDRREVEYSLIYSRSLENYYVTWLAPDGKGKLVDRDNRAFEPKDYDVVWVHQLQFHQVPTARQTPTPRSVLMPALLDGTTVQALRTYLENGGGLLLTGIAGLYALPLGVEKTAPDHLRENAYVDRGFKVGLVAAPGFEKHPVFEGLPEKDLYTNGNFPGTNPVPECAWEKRRPAGLVVANQIDGSYGTLEDYAAIVEYGLGKGKILVFGGEGCDLNPSQFGIGIETDDRTRKLTLNALFYLSAQEKFQSGPSAGKSVFSLQAKPVFLPRDNWLFKPDPSQVGEKEKWFRLGLDTKNWQNLRVDANWETQGFDNYDGFGWYRRMFTASNRPGKRTFLHFGAVDEEAVIFIDGKLVGKHQDGPTGWDQPFEIDITGFLTETSKEHLLAVEVFDSMAAGGIWKPVSLIYRDLTR